MDRKKLKQQLVHIQSQLSQVIDSFEEQEADRPVNPGESNCLAIVVGHTRKAPGAVAAAPISAPEYEYNTGLADLIKDRAAVAKHHCKVFFRDGIGIKGAYDQVEQWFRENPDKDCAVVELHFNAFKPGHSVQGTETLYCADKDGGEVNERLLAQMVQNHICKAMGRSPRQDRGIKNRPKSEGEAGWYNVNQVFKWPSVLIEPGFYDNPADAKIGHEKKEKIAEAVVRAFDEFTREG